MIRSEADLENVSAKTQHFQCPGIGTCDVALTARVSEDLASASGPNAASKRF